MNAHCHWVISAAVAIVSAGLIQSAALGQYQTADSAGRALDANNRLGSGGINEGGGAGPGPTAEDIIYGNVTSGRQFRGRLNSTDPREFRGQINRPSDNLVRDSGPSAYSSASAADRLTPRTFYGDNRGVNAPMGFQQLQPGSPGQFEIARPVFRMPGDVRMDATIPNPDLGLSQPSVYILPGVSAETPIPGALPRTNLNSGLAADRNTTNETLSQPLSNELLHRINLDENRIREMRDELRRSIEGVPEAPANPNDLTVAPENPINRSLDARIASDVQAEAMSGSLQTQQSLRQRLLTAAPNMARQDTQYAMLRDRLAQFRQRRELTDEEANRQFMNEWNQSQKNQSGQARTPGPLDVNRPSQSSPDDKTEAANTSGDDTTLGLDRRRLAILRQREAEREQVGKPEERGVLPPQPKLEVRIASFADGVKATGLKNLLTEAERSMREGKYTQALDYYDAAAAVAPDHSMVLMGRALAELGAGYYARSQVHLQQVLSADPALLLARYDLKAFFGEDRLQYIVRDLKDLAQTETRQSRPLFLLGFIAYSTESDQRASDYLALAEQRGGSTDFYNELREYWQLNKEKQKPEAPAPVPQ